jgi:hypothetical protein
MKQRYIPLEVWDRVFDSITSNPIESKKYWTNVLNDCVARLKTGWPGHSQYNQLKVAQAALIQIEHLNRGPKSAVLGETAEELGISLYHERKYGDVRNPIKTT